MLVRYPAMVVVKPATVVKNPLPSVAATKFMDMAASLLTAIAAPAATFVLATTPAPKVVTPEEFIVHAPVGVTWVATLATPNHILPVVKAVPSLLLKVVQSAEDRYPPCEPLACLT